MANLDREFLERLGGMIAQLKMLATLHKRADLVAEVEQWERRRKALLERIETSAARGVLHFRTNPHNGLYGTKTPRY